MSRFVWMLAAVFLGFSIGVQNGHAQEAFRSDATATLLKKPLKTGEAVVWFLGRDGFAVKTKTHLLIFDYYTIGDTPTHPSLANGFVNPKEIEGLDVVVFVSHRDPDHYDKVIWQWRKSVKRIQYVLGFEPSMAQVKYVHLQPGTTGRVGDVEVTTFGPSTDSGEAYLIKVDGLSLYHAGDFEIHAADSKERERVFNAIDSAATKASSVDLLFFNWRPSTPASQEGFWYAFDKLHAHAVFPMHLEDGDDPLVKDLINAVPSAERRARIVDKERRGQNFVYSNGKIVD